MTFDTSVPSKLKNIQTWFAGVITQPIDSSSRINPKAPSGKFIKEEAPSYIRPSLKQESWERIQIYNQQYWWRLFTILHNDFPLLVRLFGYRDFNFKIAVPY